MTANQQMALRVVWGTRLDDDTPAADARELLAMCGLIEPDGHEILPDITGGTLVAASAGAAPGKNADEPPLRRQPGDLPPANVTTPPGLRVLPPLADAIPTRTKPTTPARRRASPVAKPPIRRPAETRQKPPIRHGTLYGYTEHSKRKEPIPPGDPCGCRAAGAAYFRDHAAKKSATTRSTP